MIYVLRLFRFLVLQLEKKSDAWIQTTQTSDSLKSKLTRGIRYLYACPIIQWLNSWIASHYIRINEKLNKFTYFSLTFRFSIRGCLQKPLTSHLGFFNTHRACVTLRSVSLNHQVLLIVKSVLSGFIGPALHCPMLLMFSFNWHFFVVSV